MTEVAIQTSTQTESAATAKAEPVATATAAPSRIEIRIPRELEDFTILCDEDESTRGIDRVRVEQKDDETIFQATNGRIMGEVRIPSDGLHPGAAFIYPLRWKAEFIAAGEFNDAKVAAANDATLRFPVLDSVKPSGDPDLTVKVNPVCLVKLLQAIGPITKNNYAEEVELALFLKGRESNPLIRVTGENVETGARVYGLLVGLFKSKK